MKRTLLLVVLAPVALAGCQTIKSHNPFRHKAPQYQSAQQERPLEVPPGMDQPATSEALTIPNAGTAVQANGNTSPTTATAAPGGMTPPAIGQAPAAADGGGAGVTLQDTPDSAYHRVGLALARGDVGQVTSKDDVAHTYQVAVNSVVTKKAEGGFFHRLFHRDSNEMVTGTVTVSIAPQGAGSVVQASGNPSAVERVMSMLRQRLGGG